jgi:hypothetical protein
MDGCRYLGSKKADLTIHRFLSIKVGVHSAHLKFSYRRMFSLFRGAVCLNWTGPLKKCCGSLTFWYYFRHGPSRRQNNFFSKFFLISF